MLGDVSLSRTHLHSPRRTSENGLDSDQQPLAGVILCCTSIPTELRDQMCDNAREMGAVLKLDLTSDVTHLIVGATDTPKYKYVAKERPDIKVLLPSWLEAVRERWMAGGQIHLSALNLEHRLPTLWRLNICVTGFNDLDERSLIQQQVVTNGATYQGDLTKQVTHLIAAAPSGKKYEYAGQWRIKIVSIEWLQQSLERGLMLEETLYSPIMPVDQRGIGAFKTLRQLQSERASLGKRNSSDRPSGPVGPEGKRKLRRTASSKLESQNSGIWDDMGNANGSGAGVGAEWDESGAAADETTAGQQEPLPKDTHTHSEGSLQPNMLSEPSEQVYGILAGCTILILGFEDRQASLLHYHCRQNGAEVVSQDELHIHSVTQNDRVFCLVPWTTQHSYIQRTLNDFGIDAQQLELVTNNWLEKTLYSKTILDPQSSPVYRPLKHATFDGFNDWTITPTSFADFDLLHFSKAVKLTGARYDESLQSSTSVLVCGPNALPNREKVTFAHEHGIPVVSGSWFWTSLEEGTIQGTDRCVVERSAQPARESGGAGNTSKSNQRSQKYAYEAPKPSPKYSTSSRHSGSREFGPAPERTSQPLQELSGNESSRQRRSQPPELIAITEKDPFNLPRAKDKMSFMTHEDDESLQQQSENASAPSKPSATQQSRQDQQHAISNAIDHLRAHTHSASGAATESSPQHRRHRKLGRAISNPSSIESRQAPKQQTSIYEEADDDEDYNEQRKQQKAFMPSQALMYEHEEGKLAREQLMRRTTSNGQPDEDGMTRVEAIGQVKDYTAGRVGSKRRGVTR